MRVIAALGGHPEGSALLTRNLTLHALSGQELRPTPGLSLLSRDEQRALGVLQPAGTVVIPDVQVTLDNQGNSVPQIGGRRVTHVPYHSPTGMSHGYSGSGPSDLALAILNWLLPPVIAHDHAADLDDLEVLSLQADPALQPVLETYLAQQRAQLPQQPATARPEIIASRFALKWHQQFKFDFLAGTPQHQAFMLSGQLLTPWINRQLAAS